MKIKDRLRSILKIPFLESTWCKLVKSKFYGTFLTLFTPNHYSYTSPSTREVNRNGICSRLDISNIVDWNLYFGFKEIAKNKLFSLAKNPSAIIDVGANIGKVFFRFASKFSQTKVIGFEPHPSPFKVLSGNSALNSSLKNVSFVNLGLGSVHESVLFEERETGNPGMNRITSNTEKSSHKIDVESHEHEVLKDAVELLENNHPILFIELDDSNLMDQGSSAKDLIPFIHSFNYAITHAETDEIITENNSLENSHFDIICRPSI